MIKNELLIDNNDIIDKSMKFLYSLLIVNFYNKKKLIKYFKRMFIEKCLYFKGKDILAKNITSYFDNIIANFLLFFFID